MMNLCGELTSEARSRGTCSTDEPVCACRLAGTRILTPNRPQ
jgi:hypothetical protein